MDATMIFTHKNSSLIPMDFVDELTLITNEHQPFKTLISDTPFIYFFLFLYPLLLFSFSLRSMDLIFLHLPFYSFSLHSVILFLKLTKYHWPFTHLAIEFVITLLYLFANYTLYKGLTLPYYHISSLKGVVGKLANVYVILLVMASEWAAGIMKEDSRQLVIIRLFQKRIIGWLYSIQMKLLLLEIEDDAQRNEDEDGGESSICKNGKDCLHTLGSELGNDTIAPVAFPQLPVYLTSPRWQERLAGLVALAEIDLIRETIPEDISEQVMTVALNFFQHPPYPRVRRAAIIAIQQLFKYSNRDFKLQCYNRVLSLFQNPLHPADIWAAIDVIGHLSNYVGPTFQVMVQDCVFQTLRSALYGVQEIQNNFDELLLDLLQNSHRPVKSATGAALLQLSNDLDPNLPLPLPFHLFLLPALAEIMSAFQYPGDQDAAAFVMIHISTKYPIDTSPYLRVTLGTLLEVRRREDIASDQTRIHEIRNFLEMLEARLPHETLTSTLDGLSPEQRVEFCAILLNEDTYGE